MNDMGPVPPEELDKVAAHRWSFQGALELAAQAAGMSYTESVALLPRGCPSARQGKSICYFILREPEPNMNGTFYCEKYDVRC